MSTVTTPRAPDRRELGERISSARRSAQLTQTELGEYIGLSLWEVERLESGEGDFDYDVLFGGVATATAHPPEFFRHPSQAGGEPAQTNGDGDAAAQLSVEEQGSGDLEAHAPRGGQGRLLVLGFLATLIVVRFFSEKIGVLPKAATLIDVPLFMLLVAVAAMSPRGGAAGRASAGTFYVPVVLFLAIAVGSTMANLGRIAPGPVLLFLYGFCAPIGVYHAVHRLWPTGNVRSLSSLLFGLGVVEILAVLLIDMPSFLAGGNPDDISGTFGDNAYQLVAFLLVLVGLLAGMRIFEPGRLAARLATPMLVAFAVIIFLAQYRALLVSTFVVMVFLALLLGTVARGRGLLLGAFIVAAFFAGLYYVAANYPSTKFQPLIASFREKPWYFATTKLAAVDAVGGAYSDHPLAALGGTGPGTFSSRAWRTFAQPDVNARTTVAGPYVVALTGGAYRSDVAEKYVVPRMKYGAIVQGSKAVSWPLSSYTSLLAEVGVIGFALMVGIYVAAFVRASRLAVVSMQRAGPGDPLPAILLAAAVAFFLLLQLAVLDNWLELTRMTFLAWTLLAVGAKELRAREDTA